MDYQQLYENNKGFHEFVDKSLRNSSMTLEEFCTHKTVQDVAKSYIDAARDAEKNGRSYQYAPAPEAPKEEINLYDENGEKKSYVNMNDSERRTIKEIADLNVHDRECCLMAYNDYFGRECGHEPRSVDDVQFLNTRIATLEVFTAKDLERLIPMWEDKMKEEEYEEPEL